METTAKNKIKNVVDLLETAEVLDVINSFSKLTAEDASGKKEDIQKAREAYNQLSEEQKELLKDENVEEKLKAAEDMVIVSDTVGKINTIGNVTTENLTQKKGLIEDALKAYEELSDEQKALVPAEVKSVLDQVEALYRSASTGTSPQPNTGISPQPNTGTLPQPNAGVLPQASIDQKQITDISNKLGVSVKVAQKIKNYADKYGIDIDTVLLTEADILRIKTDKDAKGSSYGKLQAKASKVSASQIKLTWKKAKEADGYRIYQAECGKKEAYKLIKDIKKKSAKSYSVKKLQKGKGYRFLICAYKVIGGKNVTVSAAKTVHAFTLGGKKGNVTTVETDTTKLNLKRKKKYKIKASVEMSMKKGVKCRGICYESSDTKVATVSSKGKVTGKGKGKCTIYVYAHNGVCTPVVVKVK